MCITLKPSGYGCDDMNVNKVWSRENVIAIVLDVGGSGGLDSS